LIESMGKASCLPSLRNKIHPGMVQLPLVQYIAALDPARTGDAAYQQPPLRTDENLLLDHHPHATVEKGPNASIIVWVKTYSQILNQHGAVTLAWCKPHHDVGPLAADG
jgi:hypothetical protein